MKQNLVNLTYFLIGLLLTFFFFFMVSYIFRNDVAAPAFVYTTASPTPCFTECVIPVN